MNVIDNLNSSKCEIRHSWTLQEISYLNLHKTESIQQLAIHLNRSESPVRNKLKRLGYIRTSPKRPWNKYEEDYLYRYYGKYSISVLANHLHRTNSAVKHKAESLGLAVYSEYWSLRLLSRAFQVDIRVLHRWHDKYGMPWSMTNHDSNLYYCVKENEFWKWAIANKQIISWKKYIYGSLTGEPDNLNQLITGSKIPVNSRKSYTPSEISKIRFEYYSGHSFKNIAMNNGRTMEAVKHVIERKTYER